MSKIYMPNDTTYNKCYVVQSSDVIRGYDRTPSQNSSYNYRDYYINSNYIYKDGNGTWNNYSTLPLCIASDVITNDFYFRNDFSQITIMFFVINIFAIYLPIKIFSKILRKGVL